MGTDYSANLVYGFSVETEKDDFWGKFEAVEKINDMFPLLAWYFTGMTFREGSTGLILGIQATHIESANGSHEPNCVNRIDVLGALEAFSKEGIQALLDCEEFLKEEHGITCDGCMNWKLFVNCG